MSEPRFDRHRLEDILSQLESTWQELRELRILADVTDATIPAGGSVNLPTDEGVDIQEFKFKTISLWSDWTGLKYYIEVSDDLTFVDYPSLYDGSLTASILENPTFEADFKYLRMKVENPDTLNHTIKVLRIKGRRL
jgi:hypothetical protein